MMTDAGQPVAMGEAIHAGCILCGRDHPDGYGLHFILDDVGVAAATFDCHARFTGYPGRIHGGVVASLLDSAMTNCLYLHGHTALTAELVVRYHQGLAIGTTAIVRARIESIDHPVFRMAAWLEQHGQRIARARARFMPLPTTPA